MQLAGGSSGVLGRLFYVLGCLAALGLGVLLSVTPAPRAGAPPVPDAAVPVRVTSEIVSAATVNARIVAAPPAREHARPHVESHAAAPRSLAARIFFGDGRYRPQPFPRPDR